VSSTTLSTTTSACRRRGWPDDPLDAMRTTGNVVDAGHVRGLRARRGQVSLPDCCTIVLHIGDLDTLVQSLASSPRSKRQTDGLDTGLTGLCANQADSTTPNR
jgi:hypothetical protein